MALHDRLTGYTGEAEPKKKPVSLFNRLGAGKEPEISSPLLKTPTPPSPQPKIVSPTSEQLKTQEYESYVRPPIVPGVELPQPAGIPGGPFGGFIVEDPVESYFANLATGSLAAVSEAPKLAAKAVREARPEAAYETMQNIGKVYPVVDAALTTAYNFVVTFPAEMGGFVGGLASDIGEGFAGEGWDLESARKGFENVNNLVAATPLTEGGRQLVDAVFGTLDKAATKLGEVATDKTGDPRTGATVYSAAQMLPYVIGGRLIRSSKASGKPLTAEDVRSEVEGATQDIQTKLRKGGAGYRVPSKKLSPEAEAIANEIKTRMGVKLAEEPKIVYKPKGNEPKAPVPPPETAPVQSSEAAAETITKSDPAGYKPLASGKPRPIPVDDTPILPSKEILEEVMEGTKGITADEVLDIYGKRTLEQRLADQRKVVAEMEEPIAIEREGEIPAAEQIKVQKLRAFERKAPKELTPEEEAEARVVGEQAREIFRKGRKVVSPHTGEELKNVRIVGRPEPTTTYPIGMTFDLEGKPIMFQAETTTEGRFATVGENAKGKLEIIWYHDSYAEAASSFKSLTGKAAPELVTAKPRTTQIPEAEKRIGKTKIEPLKPEKDLVSMDEVHKESENIRKEAKDLNELSEKMQELTTRYENNLDKGFVDAFEENRYREWGDEMMEKINQARRQEGLIEEPPPEVPPDEIIGFGGTGEFQKMYERFVAGVRKSAEKKGQKLSPELNEMLDKGEIVSRRKVQGRYRLPIYRAELEILKHLKKLKETWLRRGFENPIRTFEEAGGEPFLDLTIHQYHARELGAIRLQQSLAASRKELFKGTSAKTRRRVAIHAINKQKGGRAKLVKSGIKEKDIPDKLVGREAELYDALRDRFESWYRRLSNLRVAIGKEPFPKTDDYFTFIRNYAILENAGFRPLDMPSDMLNAQFTKMGATPFKFAIPRKGALYKLELDPVRILEIYEKSAARHIQLSPFIAKMRELQSGIKDPETGKRFRLVNENPILARSLHAWTNHIAGMRSPTFQLPPAVENIMMRVNSNLAASILGANARSAMIQISALRNTVAEIGVIHSAKGVLSLISPKARNFALKKSKVLSQRTYDVTVEDALREIKSGKIGAIKRVGAKAAMKPLQILDMETAKATWQGAYDFGRSKLHMSEGRAINYADDVVTKTQASAMPGDIAPIQRSVAGKFLTLFQTFTINDWDYLVKDVLGMRRGGPMTKAHLAKAMRYVAATVLFNSLFEDVLHIQTPFPSPIRAFKESLDNGDSIPSLAWNVAGELIEPIPIVGAARYGKGPTGPGGELLQESVKFVKQEPTARPWWELGGKWFGVPGTAQLGKSVRAAKRGESRYGQIVGTYTPPSAKLKTMQGLRDRLPGLRSLE